VEFLVNDLSLHGQFQDLVSFRSAIERVMAIRQVTQRFGRALHCHRGLLAAQITPTMTMPQAVQGLSLDERRALLQWITQQGPFWEDKRSHGPGDWFEWNSEIVTDKAIGEAAHWCLSGIERRLVSFSPSDWLFSPVSVVQVQDDGGRKFIDIENHWDPLLVETVLRGAPAAIGSWEHVEAVARPRCARLTLAEDAFSPLRGHPFVPGAAHRLLVLLDVLHNLKGCFTPDGQRTPTGQQIIQDHFTGDKAWFSDSSDTEKRMFESELTFRRPGADGESLFCTWHGKVKTPQLRIHFSWPIRSDEPLYVVYIGPKITKR
jgi:hypothetical protein